MILEERPVTGIRVKAELGRRDVLVEDNPLLCVKPYISKGISGCEKLYGRS